MKLIYGVAVRNKYNDIRHGYLRYEMYGNKSKSFYVKFVFLIL